MYVLSDCLIGDHLKWFVGPDEVVALFGLWPLKNTIVLHCYAMLLMTPWPRGGLHVYKEVRENIIKFRLFKMSQNLVFFNKNSIIIHFQADHKFLGVYKGDESIQVSNFYLWANIIYGCYYWTLLSKHSFYSKAMQYKELHILLYVNRCPEPWCWLHWRSAT